MAKFATKVWTLTTDTDGGMWTSVHPTWESCKEAAWGFLETYWDMPRAEIIKENEGVEDPFEIWFDYTSGDAAVMNIDTMIWSSHDIEVEV